MCVALPFCLDSEQNGYNSDCRHESRSALNVVDICTTSSGLCLCSGVRPADLRNAEPFEVVQREAAEILTGRIIVGHSITNDLQVVGLLTAEALCPAKNQSIDMRPVTMW